MGWLPRVTYGKWDEVIVEVESELKRLILIDTLRDGEYVLAPQQLARVPRRVPYTRPSASLDLMVHTEIKPWS